MSFGRIALAWVGVTLWLVVVGMATRRWMTGEGDVVGARGARVLTLVDAALITLFGALWFASLGSGAWWLVFGLLGLLVGVERTVESAALSIAKGRESRVETAVESRESRVEETLSREHGGAQPRSMDSRLSTLDFSRGVVLSTVRFLGSGLILSLLL